MEMPRRWKGGGGGGGEEEEAPLPFAPLPFAPRPLVVGGDTERGRILSDESFLIGFLFQFIFCQLRLGDAEKGWKRGVRGTEREGRRVERRRPLVGREKKTLAGREIDATPRRPSKRFQSAFLSRRL